MKPPRATPAVRPLPIKIKRPVFPNQVGGRSRAPPRHMGHAWGLKRGLTYHRKKTRVGQGGKEGPKSQRGTSPRLKPLSPPPSHDTTRGVIRRFWVASTCTASVSVLGETNPPHLPSAQKVLACPISGCPKGFPAQLSGTPSHPQATLDGCAQNAKGRCSTGCSVWKKGIGEEAFTTPLHP
ncbi:hypothetical protein TNIN_426141 [Trichonephila inaurata madagascariensis]|uniref:Uncharacterized protein n=1 Tax=Trichonephila inaurata madagascariensis TaxID=2747483 RepID=A0A8X6M5R7_9ARAC|nr:hypothetical protein TNIN_426141 [Trichonephila inaurata madagascariensis]